MFASGRAWDLSALHIISVAFGVPTRMRPLAPLRCVRFNRVVLRDWLYIRRAR
jgi:hypothetical protein